MQRALHHHIAAKLLALALVATALVALPAPTLVAAQEMQTTTERVTLGRRPEGRPPQALSAELAAEPTTSAALRSPGRRAVTRTADTVELLGVTLPEPPSEPLFARALVDGTWTPWSELVFAPDEAPDPGTESPNPGAHSQPIWFGGASAYELDGPASVAVLDVHVVREVQTTRKVALSTPSASAATAPAIQPRSAWGARPPKVRPSITGDLKLAIVHHSVNSNSYTAADVPALLRSIQAYHMDANGWDDIAYNFAVDRFGRIWEARAGGTDRVVLGGHSAGFNTGSTGVVVLGDFRSSVPPAAATDAVAQIIAWKLALHRVDPASKVPYTTNGSSKFPAGTSIVLPRIVGHRDVQTTSCPGDQLYTRLGAIRTRVAQLVPEDLGLIAPTLVAADLDGNGLTDAVEHHPGPPQDALWRNSGANGFVQQGVAITNPYRPVVGDLDGNGFDDIVWHGSGTTRDVIWWSRAGGTDSQVLDINASYIPFVGDFDGNGLDDVFWYSTGIGSDAVWYLDANRKITSARTTQDLITGVPVVGDFDGDQRDDIFWYGPGSASDSIWWSAGRTWTVTSLSVNGWYTPAVLGNAATGRDEVLMLQPGSTTSYRWDFSSTRSITSRTLSTPAITGTPVVGDYDGDGHDDAFIYAPGSDGDAVWYSTPTAVGVLSLDVGNLYVVASGPMDVVAGAATDDLLLVSPSGGDYLWRMQTNRTITSTRVG